MQLLIQMESQSPCIAQALGYFQSQLGHRNNSKHHQWLLKFRIPNTPKTVPSPIIQDQDDHIYWQKPIWGIKDVGD